MGHPSLSSLDWGYKTHQVLIVRVDGCRRSNYHRIFPYPPGGHGVRRRQGRPRALGSIYSLIRSTRDHNHKIVLYINEIPYPLILGDFDLVCPRFVQVVIRLRRRVIIVCNWLESAPFSDRPFRNVVGNRFVPLQARSDLPKHSMIDSKPHICPDANTWMGNARN